MHLYKMNIVRAVFLFLCGIILTCELLPGAGTIPKALQFSVASNVQKQIPRKDDVERKASISSMKDLQTVEESQKELEARLAETLTEMPKVLVAMIAQYCKPLTFALKKKWKPSDRHSIDTVSCSPDGRVFASGGSDGVATFWDMYTLQKQKNMGMPNVKRICFSMFLSSNYFLASGGEGDDLYTWDYDKERLVAIAWLGWGTLLNIFCSDTERLYVKESHKGSDTMEIRILEESNVDSVFLKGHTAELTSAAFSPDGKQVVSAAYDRTIRLWDRVTGKELYDLACLVSASKVTWSPNGTFIVSAHYNHTISVLDVVTKAFTHELQQGRTYNWNLPLIVSSDSTLVVFRDDECQIKAWNLESERVQTLPVDGEMIGLAFSPCGTKLIGGGIDGSLYVWEGS